MSHDTDAELRARKGAAARTAVAEAGGLVTTQELAQEWGVSPVSLGERIRAGRFPAPFLKVGRVRLFLRDEVEPYRRPGRPGRE